MGLAFPLPTDVKFVSRIQVCVTFQVRIKGKINKLERMRLLVETICEERNMDVVGSF